jgi:hypothetical protein
MNASTDPPDSLVSPDALNNLVAGIEERVSDAETHSRLYFGPPLAQGQGADPPPSDLSEPIWREATGWEERKNADVALLINAPDEFNPEEATPDQ